MTSIRCRGVLFDLDGVLVDSTPAVARVWAGWARTHGFDPDEVVKKAHGRPSIATIRELLPGADHTAEDREVERARNRRHRGSRSFARRRGVASSASPGTMGNRNLVHAAAGRRAHCGSRPAEAQASGYLDRCETWEARPGA